MHFWLLLTMMPVVAALSWQLNRLRGRLSERTQALEVALERNLRLASCDDLTGLVNRRYILELAQQQLQRAERGATGYCVALIDLDYFERINDFHGHAAGDAVLRAFATVAVSQVRASDTIARWGGEEFLVLMPESSLPAAREGIERLRRVWAAQTIGVGSASLSATLSAGVVQRRSGEKFTAAIERADAALYDAKASGRNRLIVDQLEA